MISIETITRENALVFRDTRLRALQDALTPPMTEGKRVASIGG